MIGLMVAALVLQADAIDRAHEGDWYVSDTTDNNNGDREVYAFATHITRDDPNYLTVTMRCTEGRPTVELEWDGFEFADKTVITIGPVATPDSEPVEQQYVFSKSPDSYRRNLVATPETSATIVAAIGGAKYAFITAHLAAGPKGVGVDVAGTRGAWSRVVRHCPIKKLPQPPL